MCIRDSYEVVKEMLEYQTDNDTPLASSDTDDSDDDSSKMFGGGAGASSDKPGSQKGAEKSRTPVLDNFGPVSYTHLRAHETVLDLVCRLLLEKKKKRKRKKTMERKKKR
eukprot:TRINITY_DN15344_c0_g1_i1.p1 TRINITY_DN15344_c0_g1~~TRINITY_DN15344_c0_g1_i1.p1  ORF type:complete len:110 (-),score=52.24 TRINITY_DN15344_c0_g1_i1:64-393(-)